MTQEEIRKKLDKYIKEKGTNYRDLSLAIGRKDSYIHQYIKYGLPSKLKEEDRHSIATILDIPEQELSEKPLVSIIRKEEKPIISIDILDVTACCGNGLEIFEEKPIGSWEIPIIDFKNICSGSPKDIKMIKAVGDSMMPTICDGDWVLVDISFKYPSSDGIYLLRLSTGLAIKRIQGGVLNELSIISDNNHYAPLLANISEVQILGRVVYILNANKV